MKLSAFAQLGVRAAIAVLIAWAISHGLGLDRPYWAILTSILLISQSWGETINRAWLRFAMTIVGCGLGTFIAWQCGGQTIILFIIMLVCAFLIVYNTPVHFARAMFFMGLGIALLFSLMHEWNVHTLWVRVYETGIACMVVIVVTGVFKPKRLREGFCQDIEQLFIKVSTLFQEIASGRDSNQRFDEAMLTEVGLGISRLRTTFTQVRYEVFFMRQRRRRLGDFLKAFGLAIHYINNLLAVLSELKLADKADHELWETVMNTLIQRFNEVEQRLVTRKVSNMMPPLDDIIEPLLSNIFGSSQSCANASKQNLVGALYYSQQLDEQLRVMANAVMTVEH